MIIVCLGWRVDRAWLASSTEKASRARLLARPNMFWFWCYFCDGCLFVSCAFVKCCYFCVVVFCQILLGCYFLRSRQTLHAQSTIGKAKRRGAWQTAGSQRSKAPRWWCRDTAECISDHGLINVHVLFRCFVSVFKNIVRSVYTYIYIYICRHISTIQIKCHIAIY